MSAASDHQIIVSDPQNSGGFKSYVHYGVKSNVHGDIRRRYSDFDWLREKLRHELVGLYIPALPPKKMIGNQGEAFVSERMKFLQIFMNDVVQIPYLHDHPLLKSFFTIPMGRDWDQYKKNYTPLVSAGISQWNEAVDRMTPVTNPDATMNQLKSELDFLEKETDSCVASARRLLKATSAYAEAVGAFQKQTSSLRSLHYNTAQAMRESMPELSAAHDGMCEDMAYADSAFGVWEQQLNLQAPEVGLFLHDNLLRQLYHIRAMKDMVKFRDELMAAYTSATNHRDGLEIQLQTLKSKEKTKPEKIAQVEEKIEAAKVAANEALVKVTRCTKAVLMSEIPRSCADYHHEFRSGLGQFAAVNLASAQRFRQSWQRLISDMHFDLTTIAPQTRESLERGAIVKSSSANPFAPAHAAAADDEGGAGAGAGEGDDDDGEVGAAEAVPAPSAPPATAAEAPAAVDASEGGGGGLFDTEGELFGETKGDGEDDPSLQNVDL